MSRVSLYKEVSQAAAIACRVEVIEKLVDTGYYAGIVPPGEYKRLIKTLKGMKWQVHLLIDTFWDVESYAIKAMEMKR